MSARLWAMAVPMILASGAGHAADALKSAPTALDSGRAYILVRLGERSPDLWNTLTLAPYDEKVEDIRGKGRAKANAPAKTDDKLIVIGPKPFLAEENHIRTHLIAITPGHYVIAAGPTTCFCLGSYQFDAVGGKISDLGTIYIGLENGTSTWKALSQLRSSPDIEERGYTIAEAMAVYPYAATMATPVALQSLPRVAVGYAPAARFGNHYGKLLNRALPLGGGQ
jgi:hypothetical protein